MIDSNLRDQSKNVSTLFHMSKTTRVMVASIPPKKLPDNTIWWSMCKLFSNNVEDGSISASTSIDVMEKSSVDLMATLEDFIKRQEETNNKILLSVEELSNGLNTLTLRVDRLSNRLDTLE